MAAQSKGLHALTMATISFTVCFAAWVINAILITFLVSNAVFDFSDSQVAWLLSFPILTGALTRVPLGLLTDAYGGKPVMIIVMLIVSGGLYGVSFATSYSDFVLASLVYGVAGGAFAVGVGFVSAWTSKERQGTALGVFGMGNAGAAATTLLAPQMLGYFTEHGQNLEGWRLLPKAYAAIILIATIAFFFITANKRAEKKKQATLATQLAPLKSPIVWRFGFYYFIVFGGFVTLAQWIVPYAVNVYNMSLVQAGLIASLFSLPSGVIRALGGWLSDKYGARWVMQGVFLSSIVACLILGIPKMEIESPGPGYLAKKPGTVTDVSTDLVTVNDTAYPLTRRPDRLPAQTDDGDMWLPQITSWHVPAVTVEETVVKNQLLARGVTQIYYPANIWLFGFCVIVIGITTGIGKAAVYKFIPDTFPDSVGAVGGMVGLIGAMGGFVLPPLFGYALTISGLWASCWAVLVALLIIAQIWMQVTFVKMMKEEVPELGRLLERAPSLALNEPISIPGVGSATNIESIMQRIPFFHGLTTEQLKRLSRLLGRASADKGDVVFAEGSPGDRLYIILKGKVAVAHYADGGTRIPLGEFGPGNFFGELALIDGKPRSAEVRAIEDCEFVLLGRNDFLSTVAGSPRILAGVLSGLSTKLRDTLQKGK